MIIEKEKDLVKPRTKETGGASKVERKKEKPKSPKPRNISRERRVEGSGTNQGEKENEQIEERKVGQEDEAVGIDQIAENINRIGIKMKKDLDIFEEGIQRVFKTKERDNERSEERKDKKKKPGKWEYL